MSILLGAYFWAEGQLAAGNQDSRVEAMLMCKERIEASLTKVAGTKESNLPLTASVQ
jgi:hypothetical protein